MSTSNSSTMGGWKCWCGIPACLKISWTQQNPGRRFVACKFYNPETGMRGCKFFKWIDEDMTSWQRNIINELLEEQRALKNELKQQRSDVDEARKIEAHVNKLASELETLKKERKKNKVVLALVFVLIFVMYGKMV